MSIGYVTPEANNQPLNMCFNLKYVPLCGVQNDNQVEVSHCTIFKGCACLTVSHFKLVKDFHSVLHTMLNNLGKILEKNLFHFIL